MWGDLHENEEGLMKVDVVADTGPQVTAAGDVHMDETLWIDSS